MPATDRAIELATTAAEAASDKIATTITGIDVSGHLPLTDVFLIATGRNERQVSAIAREIEDALILGLIVLIRTVLSMSIQIEIEGVLPWRRALRIAQGSATVAITATARAIGLSLRTRIRPCSATSAAIAPTVSSIGTDRSRRCR